MQRQSLPVPRALLRYSSTQQEEEEGACVSAELSTIPPPGSTGIQPPALTPSFSRPGAAATTTEATSCLPPTRLTAPALPGPGHQSSGERSCKQEDVLSL